MSYTEGYLEFITEQAKGKLKGPRDNDSGGGLGFDFGPQKSAQSPQHSLGGRYSLALLDVDTLPTFLKRQSGKGPGTLNQSVIIYGRPGVGKSAIVKYTARQLAQELGRTFIDFNRAFAGSREELVEVFNNPEKYYCFIDVRAGSYEAFEFKGIPKESVDIPGTSDALDLLWIKILTMDNSAGMLFLDEINQANPETQNVLYGLLHFGERTIAEKGIRNHEFWAVHGAGNLGSQYQGTNELNKALINRVSIVYFDVTFDKWMNFAKAFMKDVAGAERPVYHPLILKFLNFVKSTYPDKVDDFFTFEEVEGVADPNPRNFEKLSDAIYSLQAEYTKRREAGDPTDDFLMQVDTIATAGLNSRWAEEFTYYLERYQKANIAQMLQDPESHFVVASGKEKKGVPVKEFFTNLSILQDDINSFVGKYLDAFGYSKYLTSAGSLLKDQNNNTLPTPEEDVDIAAYNANAMLYFNLIETMRKNNQQHNAAIVYSYLKDSRIKNVSAWPILQIALVNNLDGKDKANVSTFIKTTAQELAGQIDKAKQAMTRLAKDSSTSKYLPAAEQEDAEDPIDLTSANNLILQTLQASKRLEPRLD